MKQQKVLAVVLGAAAACGATAFAVARAQAQGAIAAPGPMRVVAIYPDYCRRYDSTKHTVAGELISNPDGVAFIATCNDGRSLELHPR